MLGRLACRRRLVCSGSPQCEGPPVAPHCQCPRLAGASSALPVILVPSAACLADVFRRPSCRCFVGGRLADASLPAGPRAVGDPRCVGTLPLSDATSVCARRPAWVPGTRKGIGRFRGTPKGGAAAPVRRSTVPPESCSSCGCGCCGSENRRIKPMRV